MAKNNNLKDFLTDVADAIREKEGSSDVINPQDFSDRIRAISAGGGWTGHADAEGLRLIGWTEEDIEYYQKHGVNWNAEDDYYHRVSEDNIALYGLLTANNIATYKDRIVYLPKIDLSAVADMTSMFSSCYSLVAVPHLNTSNATIMNSMFYYCYSLVCVPPMDTSKVTDMYRMFYHCYSLVCVPPMNTQEVTNMSSMYYNCYSLVAVPPMNTSKVTDMSIAFYACRSLINISQMNMQSVTTVNNTFYNCSSLTYVNFNSIQVALGFGNSPHLSKESLLYIINNEATESAITIRLQSLAYNRLADDADILNALASHPNITLAK